MITLTCTVHDVHGGLQWLSDLYMHDLVELFDTIIVVCTPQTNKKYTELLKEREVKVIVVKHDDVGKTYFEAIKKGWSTDADYLFYCDFDRILHWMHTYPKELKRFVSYLRREEKKKDRVDYVICERSSAAYRMHHDALYWSEQLPNMIISRKLGEKKQRDHLSGCFVYSKKAATHVVRYGGYKGQQHWGAWPIELQRRKVKISYKKFLGLEWETPDRYQEKVKQLGGVDEFRKNMSTNEEWVKRIGWAREFIEEIV